MKTNMKNGIIKINQYSDKNFIYGFDMFPENKEPLLDCGTATYFHVRFMQPIQNVITGIPIGELNMFIGSILDNLTAFDGEKYYTLKPHDKSIHKTPSWYATYDYRVK